MGKTQMACMMKNGITFQILVLTFLKLGSGQLPGAPSRNFPRCHILGLVPLEEQQVSIRMKVDSYGNKQNQKLLPCCAKEQCKDSKPKSKNQTR